jgi:aryl-alcohol dehydrogenase-like predicted oxidoreductase
MKRRDFIKYTAVTAGMIKLSSYAGFISFPAHKMFTRTSKKYANDIVTLGRTGIKVSRLAMGTGTHGFNHHSEQSVAVGKDRLPYLLQVAYEHGINFWDSADQYGTHPALKEALKSISREKVVILTKTEASTADEMRADLNRFRKEIGTDYIDIILLHMLTSPDWMSEKQGAMEVLERARESGVIRAHGVSCHTIGALRAAASSNWVQVDFARINPAGVLMDSDLPSVLQVLRKMHDEGKGVVGMKIFGAGRLVEKKDDCLKFVLGLDCVDAFTIGQVRLHETLDLINRIPTVSSEDSVG